MIFGHHQNVLQGWRCLLPSLLVGLLLPVMSIHAADEQRLPGVVDRPVSEPPADIRRQPAEVAIPAAPKGEDVADPNQELMSNLSQVVFKGVTVLDESILQEAVAPFLGKPLSAAGLAELKYAVTRQFYDRGYVLVKAVTPPQDVSDGILEVAIYEAKIGEITVHDESGTVRPYLVEQMTKRVESGEVFREGPVESMVNDVNDLAGASATINLRPGQQIGTTDMALQVQPADDDVQRFYVDNYGSELTGEFVGTAQLQKSNLLGWGETFRFVGRKSDGDLWSVLFGATVPTGLRNIKMDLDFLHSENEIGDRLAALDASGETTYFGVGFTSAIINQRHRKLAVRAGFEYRDVESFLADVTESEDNIRQVYLEANYLWNWTRTVGYASLRLTQGVDIFGASSEGDALASRIGDPQATRLQPLIYLGHSPTENGMIKAIFTGQWASDRLLASDLFVIGGYGSVRGFETGQELAEGGILMNLEYQHKVFQRDVWSVLIGPFIDAGRVFSKTDNVTIDDTLASAGIGVEISTTPSLWNYGDSNLRFDWAHTLGDYDSPRVDDNSYYFRFTQTF